MIGAARRPDRPAPPRWCRRLGAFAAVAAVAVLAPLAPSSIGPVPAAADPVDGWIEVSAGSQFACGIDEDGLAWCWGRDDLGALGNGDDLTGVVPAPSLVDAPGVRFASISAGASHACAVDTDGGGWCWGNDSFGQLGEGPGGATTRSSPVRVVGSQEWQRISAGGAFTCGLTTGRAAYCWGRDLDGELGNGTPLTSQNAPSQLTGTDWTEISTGAAHACGRRGSALSCWGQGDNGRLGTGTTTDAPEPAPIDKPPSGTWASVSAGYDHTCATTSTSALWCWGRDDRGQLGNGATTTTDQSKPISIGTATWGAVDAGRSATCGIATTGVSWCWGIDANRELGNGPALTGDQASPTLVDLPGDTKYRTISIGQSVSCGTVRDDIWCAGSRTNGAVGDGQSTGWAESPVSVAKTLLDQAIDFDPLADRTFGTGPFALQATATSGLPVSFSGGGAACSISGSTVTIRDLGTCTVTASQGGDADYRPARDETRSFTVVPATSTGTWAQVDGGSSHTCAVTTAGEAWCWGRDNRGQLGNGATETADQQAPSPVAPPTGGAV
ncbi:MAG: hypothetical protein KF703_08060, partial [Actinobacteria bacterium]|nr:hypothetical protein [Actinomycetota bacterium]